jgi:hypothetical protein
MFVKLGLKLWLIGAFEIEFEMGGFVVAEPILLPKEFYAG